jgi:E3 ubiquitin-protein ligase SHPRH
LNLFEEENENPVPKNPGSLCELCKLKHKLDEYECVLFNKAMVNDIVAGTWNPRLEERLLKVIFNNAKRANFDEENIEMGKSFFKYLESLKKQYKMFAQLWVELNFTVGAYDELNMCKIKTQVVDSIEEITEEDARFRLKITKHEVEDQIELFTSQKQEAELLFTRLYGRLKYLDHLKEKNEVPVCPICTVQAKERYYVTICGHSICAECFFKLTKERRRFASYERLKINCPVCRTTQEIGSILGVTCNAQQADSEPIVGSYSPKIDEIIRCVLQLRRGEPGVKILIFSQWDSILTAIIAGLRYNKITYRASFSSNFSKQIEEFKDSTMGVTCMMLNLKFAGKGLNLTEATHAFMVEPILNADEELQAIGRIHRIGQTRETFVHKFITKETIEETLYNKIIQEKEKWIHKQFTIRDLESLFEVQQENENDLMELF